MVRYRAPGRRIGLLPDALAGLAAMKTRRAKSRGKVGPGRAGPDITPPSLERQRHGPVERAAATVKDAQGGVGLPYRAIHTTEIMLRAGGVCHFFTADAIRDAFC